MPQFQYVAKNLQGQILKGSADTISVSALEQMLLEKGYFLTKYTSSAEPTSKSIEFGKKVKLKEFVVFSRQFAVMLNSGMTIVECISVLKEQTNNKRLKPALYAVHENILKGEMLSAAMVKTEVFPVFFVNMLQVGEASGTLENVLNRMADYYEKDMKLRKKVKSAMVYPIMVLVVTVGVVIFFNGRCITKLRGHAVSDGRRNATRNKIRHGRESVFNPTFIGRFVEYDRDSHNGGNLY